ncbi:hypothetical protein SAMN06309944_2388 [Micrococcales bacterium KH10]|nr:hypothetical protein SAMN06309944_2388 [Micrococcales bacterium KH10]
MSASSVDQQPGNGREPAQLTALLYAMRVWRTKVRHIADPVEPTGQLTAAGRAERAGLDQSQRDQVVRQVAGLDSSWRETVLNPLRAADDGTLQWCGFHVRQPDQTACVPTVLAVQSARGNIALALWLVSGIDTIGIETQLRKVVRDSLPASSSNHDEPQGGEAGSHQAQIAARFGALVRYFQFRATHRGRVRLWPSAWGTPPWGAARVARYGQYRFTSRLVNDLAADSVKHVVGAAVIAADRGVPSVLYVGGDSSTKYRDAVPRHAILLHSSDGAGLAVFEPSAGRIIPVAPEELARSGGPRQAYAGWSHIGWAVVPVQPDV